MAYWDDTTKTLKEFTASGDKAATRKSSGYLSGTPVRDNWWDELSLIGADAYDAGPWDPHDDGAGTANIEFGDKGIADTQYYGVLKDQGDAYADNFYDLHSPLGHWVGFDDQVKTHRPWHEAKDWAKTGAESGHAGGYSDDSTWGAYLGPSFSGGHTKEDELAFDRKARIQGDTGTKTEEWRPGPDFDAAASDADSPAYYGYTRQEVQDMISREFGTAQMTPSDVPTLETSEQGQELHDAKMSRATTFGSLNTEGDFNKVQERFVGPTGTGGLIEHLKPNNQGISDIYNYVYDAEGNIDWEQSVEQGTGKSAYVNAVNQYFGQGPGSQTFAEGEAYNPNFKGEMLEKFIDEDLSSFDDLEQAGVESMAAEQDTIQAQRDLNKLYKEKGEIGDPIRAEMLKSLVSGQERQYTSGFAGMGQSAGQRGEVDELLMGGQKELLGKRDEISLQETELSNAEIAQMQKENFEQGIQDSWTDPWAKLQTRWQDYGSDYGQGWQPSAQSYESELWQTIMDNA